MLGEVAALGLGIALSPSSVIPAILVLFTRRPRPTSYAFLGSWFVAVAIATGVFVLLAEVLDSVGESPRWIAWVRLAVGVALVLYGAHQWTKRHASADVPSWIRSFENATPLTAGRLALLLTLANPKVVLLAAAAGLDIGASELTSSAEVASVAAFTAVASLGVAVPVLAFAVAGDRVLRPLGVAKDWLVGNSKAVMAVVIVAIGLVVIGNGVSGL